jgi:histidinol-phosphate phosphatase family protein
MAKAVFLDRDETLNPDPGYISDPGVFMLYPWVASELARLKRAGYLLIVVSNQSGVGRGLIRHDALQAIHQKLNDLLFSAEGIRIDHFGICTHRPEDGCECRKPKPKLILDSAKKFGIDPAQSFLIGDRESDAEAGIRANLRQVFKVDPGDETSFRLAIEAILKT